MKLIKPVLWTVFGVVVGIVVTITAQQVQAQAEPVIRSERISIRSAPEPNIGRLSFVKDARSGGCWIASGDGKGSFSGVAVAPPTACD